MARFDPHSWCDGDQPRQKHLDLELTVDFAGRALNGRVRIDLAEPAAGPMDLDGRDLSSGTYLCRLQGEGFERIRKMQLVK